MAEAEWQKRHREIDELHRTILARMDESDRRAAEREKQREQRLEVEPTWAFLDNSAAEHEKRQEELRARLHAAGLREVSSDELLASVKRLSDTVDRVLQARQRSAGTGPMAEAEWQGRVDRLDEVTIVQARLMESLERKYDEAIQRHDDAVKKHDEEIADLRGALRMLHSALEKTHAAVGMTNAAVEKTNAEVQIMNSAMSNFIERFDRFIQGREGNGRKQ